MKGWEYGRKRLVKAPTIKEEIVKDHFWKNFLKQYTTELHVRYIRQSKYLGELIVLKVGDLCLLMLEMTP